MGSNMKLYIIAALIFINVLRLRAAGHEPGEPHQDGGCCHWKHIQGHPMPEWDGWYQLVDEVDHYPHECINGCAYYRYDYPDDHTKYCMAESYEGSVECDPIDHPVPYPAPYPAPYPHHYPYTAPSHAPYPHTYPLPPAPAPYPTYPAPYPVTYAYAGVPFGSSTGLDPIAQGLDAAT